MQNHNLFARILAIVLCSLLTNCATTNVPPHWLSDPDQVASDVRGGWINIKSQRGAISGELIAVTKDTVFAADSVFHAIALKDVLSARLVTYDAQDLGVYVFLGTVSTLSHGLFLVLTAPMWIIGGSFAAASRSYDPIIDYPDKSPQDFKPFARYPEGLPPDLDRRLIRMKILSVDR